MPDIRIIDLERQLRADKPSRVYFVFGSEALLKKEAVDRLLKACVPAELTDLNYQRFDGSRTSAIEIAEATGQYPIVAERRCVLVEDFDFAKAPESERSIIESCINELPDFCVLILWQNDVESSIKNKNIEKIQKLCAKKGSSLRLDTPKTAELCAMLVDRAAAMSLGLQRPEAYYLIEHCGSDLTHLTSEMDKLSVYAGKKPVTKSMIELICPPSLESDVYKISRSIIRGNNDAAFRTVGGLLAQKAEPIELFMLLCSDFIDLYRARLASDAGMSAKELINTFPFDYKGRDFRVTNAMRDQTGFSTARLKRYIELLFEAELKLKTGRTDRKACLEQLVVRLCAEGAPRK